MQERVVYICLVGWVKSKLGLGRYNLGGKSERKSYPLQTRATYFCNEH